MKKNLTFSKLMMLVIIALLPVAMFAQKGNHKQPVQRYFYLSGEGGFSINHGDLANYEGWIFEDFNKDYFLNNLNGKLGLGYQFGGVIGMNAKFGYGTLAGEKHGQFLRLVDGAATPEFQDLQLNKTTYFDGNLNLTFNLCNLFFGYNPYRVFNLIPHVGIGGIYYKAGQVNKLDANNQVVGEAVAKEKADYALTYTIPVGGELNFNLGKKVDLFVDYTYHFAGKDNLDQIAKAPTDEIEYVNDMYSQLNLGLRYKFNNPTDIDKMAREANQITMKVNPDPLVEKDGKVCFDVTVTIPPKYFEKHAVMNLTPYLTYKGGQIDLEPITFVGEKVKADGDFRVNYKEGGEYTKNYCMDYIPEIENSELKGNPMFYVYDGEIYPTQDDIVKNTYYTQGGERKLADGVVVTTKPQPTTEIVTVYDTVLVKEAAAIYYFPKNSAKIKNAKEVNKDVKALIEAGEKKDLQIEGWASPEGTLDRNTTLANDRAKAGQKEIENVMKKNKVNMDEYSINANGNGPDWVKFIELVKASNIEDKDAIVNVINNAGSQAAKEQEIRNMINVYPELEKEIFPLLRRAEILIDKIQVNERQVERVIGE